jgi:tetratricopeptide (TPR) repeat protein
LKKYVQDLYHFESNIIKVNSVPEDWQGLRNYVANSNFAQKNEMLLLLDNEQLSYDARELRLKTFEGGKAYATLLSECYPALRHSDYTVRYVVRGFSVDEAKEIITKRPQQLSLNEMFLVAQTYVSGSNEFNEVFEVAVRMFPDDPTANINAAAIELQQGNWKQAERYLLKSDPQAGATKNNEGVMNMMQGNLDKAEALFQQAKALGSAEAVKNLEEISKKRQDNALYGE